MGVSDKNALHMVTNITYQKIFIKKNALHKYQTAFTDSEKMQQ